jgi:hypothetical protein
MIRGLEPDSPVSTRELGFQLRPNSIGVEEELGRRVCAESAQSWRTVKPSNTFGPLSKYPEVRAE